MALLRGFLRVYSWIFEAVLCLGAIAFALAGFVTGGGIQLGWLPWTGQALLLWTLALGVLGLICVFFAVIGKLRVLLFLFSLGVVVLLVKGLFFGTYAFAGPDPARQAAYLAAAAMVALIGAWPFYARGVSPRAR